MRLDDIVADPELHRCFIRQLAHWYEKTFFCQDDFSLVQRGALEKKLTMLLEMWAERYPSQNPEDVLWARAVLLEGSRPYDAPGSSLLPSAVYDLFAQRTSHRKWKNMPVSLAVVDQLLDIGISSPSSANRQAVRFVVIRESSDEKSYLADLIKHDFVRRAPLIFLIGVDTRLYAAHENDRVVEDAAVCAQTMVLYGESMGLGSCYITAHEIDLAEPKIRYGIPATTKMLISLPFGYRDTVFCKPPRLPRGDHILREF